MIRLPRKRIWIPSLLLGVAGLLFLSLFIPVNPEQLYHRLGFPYRFYDRHGGLLHAGLSSNGFLFEPVEIAKIPVHTVSALVLLEDRRFFRHAGIDLKAVGRALWKRVATEEATSGASTLTMQLARNVYAWPRNIFAKMVETWFALRLERTFSKQQILEHYFNTIPFGSRIIGIQTAARRYFNRAVEKLSPAQGAYLAALVKFPAYTDTGAHRKRVRKRQLLALKLLHQEGVLDKPAYSSARKERVVIQKRPHQRIAPHFTDMLLKKLRTLYPEALHRIREVHTTLDGAVQRDCAARAAVVVRGLTNKRISNAAVVLLDNESGALRALVGSVDYFSHSAGQVNGATAVRSPGSALKPFIYAAALERNITTAAELIPDVRTDFYTRGGDYNPENYSRTYHGPVSLREALACSYNIPAVRMLRRAGIEQVLQDLRGLHFDTLNKGADWYGLTLALGGGGVTLLDMTAAYRALATGGEYRAVRMIKRVVTRDGGELDIPARIRRRVYSRATAFLLGDILADNDARKASFTAHSPLRMPFFCAAKTGTSKGFRDNWSVGYTRRWTLGVWVGNFDGTPMKGISGITGAAPLFRQILLAEEDGYGWRPDPPVSVVKRRVCALSGLLPGAACSGTREEWFHKNKLPARICTFHHFVPFRANGAIAWDAGTNRSARPMPGVIWKRVEVLPDEYHDWLKQEGRALPGADLVKFIEWQRTGIRPEPIRPLVLFPDDGDIFAIDPILDIREQRLTMRARIGGAPQKVFWLLNMTNRIPVSHPYTLEWGLQRGIWNIMVEAVWNATNRIRSRPVFFQVY